ncbi:RT23 protein, partial [Amia calva]|nr:RT23 protein [Amia calva]
MLFFLVLHYRVRDLMRSGVVKQANKPLWYDVYAAFPPKREPLYEKPTQRFGKVVDPVPDIFYSEDSIRAKFFEVFGNGPKAFDLAKSSSVSSSQWFVEKYRELERQGELDEEALFEETAKHLLSEGIMLRRRVGYTVSEKWMLDNAWLWKVGWLSQNINAVFAFDFLKLAH